LPESKCTNKKEDIAFLKKEVLSNKNFVTSLLFRASKHGFKFANFHSLSDLKGETLTLLKLKEGGICIGGYTRG
jgi:hypothetical protein